MVAASRLPEHYVVAPVGYWSKGQDAAIISAVLGLVRVQGWLLGPARTYRNIRQFYRAELQRQFCPSELQRNKPLMLANEAIC